MGGFPIGSLSTRLRDLRQAAGLSQEAFAVQAGIAYKYYQLIELGLKPDLRLSTLDRLAKGYGLEVWQLLSPKTPVVKAQFKKKRNPQERQSSKTRRGTPKGVH